MIDSGQIRAARALLRLEQRQLAEQAQVSVATIRRVEAAEGVGRVSPGTVEAVQQALEAAGAEFIENGVRRRHRRTTEEREALVGDIAAIADRVTHIPVRNPNFLDNDLYDENGLPA